MYIYYIYINVEHHAACLDALWLRKSIDTCLELLLSQPHTVQMFMINSISHVIANLGLYIITSCEPSSSPSSLPSALLAVMCLAKYNRMFHLWKTII